MSKIRIKSIKVKNYRSFGEEQTFEFPGEEYKKPIAIIGYNNAGKTNLVNVIKYGLYESVREETFELKDFHNLKWENSPNIELIFEADINDNKLVSFNKKCAIAKNNISLIIENHKIKSVTDSCDINSGYSKKWVVKQNAPIFYINFHKIKDEISTKKTSWGNLNSFLAKHIDKLVKKDEIMQGRKKQFKEDVIKATNEVLNGNENKGSELSNFIEKIKENYNHNLRNIACEIDFGLPDYEDIFLQMMFKIGLNGNKENLVPIDHFGDGYISMFVMAVIQAIAESETKDQCLFLFEEPESFLHENHQEYFYKMVLCKLAEKGHQVIYTTHSDKMIDIFDTKGLIRLEYNEVTEQTEKRYPKTKQDKDFNEQIESENILLVDEIKDFNSYIKIIEPNLNRILFSKKVILVEGPNDLMVYKYLIEKKSKELGYGDDFSKAYLNFYNIAIIPHHGKATAWILIELCKHIGLDYFVINDLDFEDQELFEKLSEYKTEEDMKKGTEYINSGNNGGITTNWKLINKSGKEKMHFNVKKLETLIGYDGNDKNAVKIRKIITDKDFKIDEKLFPKNLEDFLEFKKQENVTEKINDEISIEEIPF